MPFSVLRFFDVAAGDDLAGGAESFAGDALLRGIMPGAGFANAW